MHYYSVKRLDQNHRTLVDLHIYYTAEGNPDNWVIVNDIIFLNVYKERPNHSAVQPLLSWSLSMRSVAVGDFNSVYWA